MTRSSPSEPLSDEGLLAAWEAGSGLPLPLRPIPLLAAADPGADPDALAAQALGACNARLLLLRKQLFGPRFEAVATCPACGEALQLSLTAEALGAPAPDESPPAPAGVTVDRDGYTLRLRPVTPLDLAVAEPLRDPTARRACLLDRCLLAADHDGEPVAARDLPDAVQEAAGRALAQADPLAVFGLDVACAACDHEWTAPLDLAAFLWADLDRWARRLMRDVHALARAYGWTEAAVLALPPRRRCHYLHLAYG